MSQNFITSVNGFHFFKNRSKDSFLAIGTLSLKVTLQSIAYISETNSERLYVVSDCIMYVVINWMGNLHFLSLSISFFKVCSHVTKSRH